MATRQSSLEKSKRQRQRGLAMSVSKNIAKTYILKINTSTPTRMDHVIEQNLAKTEFLEMKTSTSTRLGHVGEQNLAQKRSM